MRPEDEGGKCAGRNFYFDDGGRLLLIGREFFRCGEPVQTIGETLCLETLLYSEFPTQKFHSC